MRPFPRLHKGRTRARSLIAGTAARGSSATRPSAGLRFFSTKPSGFPGTQIRFGIDGIIGLVPGLGDVLAGLLSLVIPLAAWMRGVPYVTLARMAVNLGIGVLVGSIPVLGDAFDIAWKPNRRNYDLLQRHLGQPRLHTWRDWAFLWMLLAALALVFAIPVVLAVWLLIWLTGQ